MLAWGRLFVFPFLIKTKTAGSADLSYIEVTETKEVTANAPAMQWGSGTRWPGEVTHFLMRAPASYRVGQFRISQKTR